MSNLSDAERVKIDAVNGIVPDIYAAVESILAARLAGAGAQVTEAAEAIAQEIETTLGTVHGLDCPGCYMVIQAARIVRAYRPAAAPHMGTGQAEADPYAGIREEILEIERQKFQNWKSGVITLAEQMGDPKSEFRRNQPVLAYVGLDIAARELRSLSASLPHMGTGQTDADLRARISALADEWEKHPLPAGRVSTWTVGECYAYELRALLDRPAAAEGSDDA